MAVRHYETVAGVLTTFACNFMTLDGFVPQAASAWVRAMTQHDRLRVHSTAHL